MHLRRETRKIGQPLLGGLLSFALIFQSVIPLSAGPADTRELVGSSARNNPELLDYYPPSDLARVTDSFISTSQRLVILIQDLHCHPGVQRKISSLLEHYSSLGIAADSVFVEGAEGPVDTTLMALFPEEKIKLQVTQEFVDQGVFTGMEDHAIRNKKAHYLWGVDDQETYALHKAFFHKSLKNRSQLSERIQTLNTRLELLGSKHFSKSMKRLEAQRHGYQNGDLSLERYLKGLRNEFQDFRLDFPEELSFMQETIKLEKAVKKSALPDETKSFLSALAPRLTKEEQERLARIAKRDASLYYLYLGNLARDHKVEGALSRNLKNFLETTRRSQTQDLSHFQRNLEDCEHKLLFAHARTPLQKNIVNAQLSLNQIQNLLELKLTKEELKALIPKTQELSALLRALLPEDFSSLQELLAEAVDFYGLALLRDQPMAERTLDKIGADGRGILVAGGFHSSGLTQIFQQKGVSYLVLSPVVESYTEADQKRYVDRLIHSTLAAGFARQSHEVEPSVRAAHLWLEQLGSEMPPEKAAQTMQDRMAAAFSPNKPPLTVSWRADQKSFVIDHVLTPGEDALIPLKNSTKSVPVSPRTVSFASWRAAGAVLIIALLAPILGSFGMDPNSMGVLSATMASAPAVGFSANPEALERREILIKMMGRFRWIIFETAFEINDQKVSPEAVLLACWNEWQTLIHRRHGATIMSYFDLLKDDFRVWTDFYELQEESPKAKDLMSSTRESHFFRYPMPFAWFYSALRRELRERMDDPSAERGKPLKMDFVGLGYFQEPLTLLALIRSAYEDEGATLDEVPLECDLFDGSPLIQELYEGDLLVYKSTDRILEFKKFEKEMKSIAFKSHDERTSVAQRLLPSLKRIERNFRSLFLPLRRNFWTDSCDVIDPIKSGDWEPWSRCLRFQGRYETAPTSGDASFVFRNYVVQHLPVESQKPFFESTERRLAPNGVIFESGGYVESWGSRSPGQSFSMIYPGIFARSDSFHLSKTVRADDFPGRTAKAPGSEELNGEEERYIQSLLTEAVPIQMPFAFLQPLSVMEEQAFPLHVPFQKQNAIFHTVDIPHLGFPRAPNARRARDLIYVYSRVEKDEKLHFYVTQRFWDYILSHEPRLLAELMDHEWAEQMNGLSHADASRRDWAFAASHEHDLSPFQRFALDQYFMEDDQETLVVLAQRPHANDPQGHFSAYAQELLNQHPKVLWNELVFQMSELEATEESARLGALNRIEQEMMRDPRLPLAPIVWNLLQRVKDPAFLQPREIEYQSRLLETCLRFGLGRRWLGREVEEVGLRALQEPSSPPRLLSGVVHGTELACIDGKGFSLAHSNLYPEIRPLVLRRELELVKTTLEFFEGVVAGKAGPEHQDYLKTELLEDQVVQDRLKAIYQDARLMGDAAIRLNTIHLLHYLGLSHVLSESDKRVAEGDETLSLPGRIADLLQQRPSRLARRPTLGADRMDELKTAIHKQGMLPSEFFEICFARRQKDLMFLALDHFDNLKALKAVMDNIKELVRKRLITHLALPFPLDEAAFQRYLRGETDPKDWHWDLSGGNINDIHEEEDMFRRGQDEVAFTTQMRKDLLELEGKVPFVLYGVYTGDAGQVTSIQRKGILENIFHQTPKAKVLVLGHPLDLTKTAGTGSNTIPLPAAFSGSRWEGKTICVLDTGQENLRQESLTGIHNLSEFFDRHPLSTSVALDIPGTPLASLHREIHANKTFEDFFDAIIIRTKDGGEDPSFFQNPSDPKPDSVTPPSGGRSPARRAAFTALFAVFLAAILIYHFAVPSGAGEIWSAGGDATDWAGSTPGMLGGQSRAALFRKGDSGESVYAPLDEALRSLETRAQSLGVRQEKKVKGITEEIRRKFQDLSPAAQKLFQQSRLLIFAADVALKQNGEDRSPVWDAALLTARFDESCSRMKKATALLGEDAVLFLADQKRHEAMHKEWPQTSLLEDFVWLQGRVIFEDFLLADDERQEGAQLQEYTAHLWPNRDDLKAALAYFRTFDRATPFQDGCRKAVAQKAGVPEESIIFAPRRFRMPWRFTESNDLGYALPLKDSRGKKGIVAFIDPVDGSLRERFRWIEALCHEVGHLTQPFAVLERMKQEPLLNALIEGSQQKYEMDMFEYLLERKDELGQELRRMLDDAYQDPAFWRFHGAIPPKPDSLEERIIDVFTELTSSYYPFGVLLLDLVERPGAKSFSAGVMRRTGDLKPLERDLGSVRFEALRALFRKWESHGIAMRKPPTMLLARIANTCVLNVRDFSPYHARRLSEFLSELEAFFEVAPPRLTIKHMDEAARELTFDEPSHFEVAAKKYVSGEWDREPLRHYFGELMGKGKKAALKETIVTCARNLLSWFSFGLVKHHRIFLWSVVLTGVVLALGSLGIPSDSGMPQWAMTGVTVAHSGPRPGPYSGPEILIQSNVKTLVHRVLNEPDLGKRLALVLKEWPALRGKPGYYEFLYCLGWVADRPRVQELVIYAFTQQTELARLLRDEFVQSSTEDSTEYSSMAVHRLFEDLPSDRLKEISTTLEQDKDSSAHYLFLMSLEAGLEQDMMRLDREGQEGRVRNPGFFVDRGLRHVAKVDFYARFNLERTPVYRQETTLSAFHFATSGLDRQTIRQRITEFKKSPKDFSQEIIEAVDDLRSGRDMHRERAYRVLRSHLDHTLASRGTENDLGLTRTLSASARLETTYADLLESLDPADAELAQSHRETAAAHLQELQELNLKWEKALSLSDKKPSFIILGTFLLQAALPFALGLFVMVFLLSPLGTDFLSALAFLPILRPKVDGFHGGNQDLLEQALTQPALLIPEMPQGSSLLREMNPAKARAAQAVFTTL